MAKSTEISVFCYIGKGSDSLGIIPDPDSKLVLSGSILCRGERDRNGTVISSHAYRNRLSINSFQIVN